MGTGHICDTNNETPSLHQQSSCELLSSVPLRAAFHPPPQVEMAPPNNPTGFNMKTFTDAAPALNGAQRILGQEARHGGTAALLPDGTDSREHFPALELLLLHSRATLSSRQCS